MRENQNKSKFTGDFIIYTSGDVFKAESNLTVTNESGIWRDTSFNVNVVLNNIVHRSETNIKPNAYCLYLNSTIFATYAFNSNTLDINKWQLAPFNWYGAI